MYWFGATCPETGETAGLILPEANTDMMNLLLKELTHRVGATRPGVVILDQAGWHPSKRLRVPENLTLVFLPPYSPELNPVERVWAYLRSHYLANRVYENYQEIVDAVCEAWNECCPHLERVKSVCRVSYLI